MRDAPAGFCLPEGQLGLELAEQLSSIIRQIEVGLTAGRTFGPTLERRLRTSVHLSYALSSGTT
jgi:hypothetical protein